MKLLNVDAVDDDFDFLARDSNIDEFVDKSFRDGDDVFGAKKCLLLPADVEHGVQPLVERIGRDFLEGIPAAFVPSGMDEVGGDEIARFPGDKTVG